MDARSRLRRLAGRTSVRLAIHHVIQISLIQQVSVLMYDPIPVVYIGNTPGGLSPAIRPLLGVILDQLDALGNVFDGTKENRSITCYRWRKSYGGMEVDQARRLKELGAENACPKRAVADLTVDKMILKEVAEGKY